jgi:pilus assembly protein CpaE
LFEHQDGLMPTYFVSDGSDPDRTASIEGRIREVVPDLIKIADIEDIVESSNDSSGPLYVLLFGPSDSEDYLESFVDLAQRNRDRLFFILIGEEISASNYKRLIRTEGADWVSASGVPQELVEVFARRRSAPPIVSPLPAERKEPVTVAFVPAAGGVGNTTLIKEVAIQLKNRKDFKDRSVCIVDLDFQTSNLCDHLDIEARLQITELLDNPNRLDTQLFELFISRHNSGVDIFAAPRSKFNVGEIDATTLELLFDMIAQRYDWILIDLPITWFGWTNEVISNSTGVIVSGINIIPCLRQVAESLTLIRSSRSQSGAVAVAINRCERGFMGQITRRGHVKSVLGDELIFYIGNEPTAIVESANTGVPVSPKGSRKLVKEITAITSFCAHIKTAGEQSRPTITTGQTVQRLKLTESGPTSA